jgi:hypothetical protein
MTEEDQLAYKELKEQSREGTERFRQQRLIATGRDAETLANKKRSKEALSEYNPAKASEICDCVGNGQLLIDVCERADMPFVKNVYNWLDRYGDFKDQFDEALRLRLLIWEEQVIQISDRSVDDISRGVDGKIKVDGEVISRSKLRMESRNRYLEAYKPERWSKTTNINQTVTSNTKTQAV